MMLPQIEPVKDKVERKLVSSCHAEDKEGKSLELTATVKEKESRTQKQESLIKILTSNDEEETTEQDIEAPVVDSRSELQEESNRVDNGAQAKVLKIAASLEWTHTHWPLNLYYFKVLQK